jgi:outer membrane PBP1 activator LpoA protein
MKLVTVLALGCILAGCSKPQPPAQTEQQKRAMADLYKQHMSGTTEAIHSFRKALDAQPQQQKKAEKGGVR